MTPGPPAGSGGSALSESFHCTAYTRVHTLLLSGLPRALLAAPTLRPAAGVVCHTPCGTLGPRSLFLHLSVFLVRFVHAILEFIVRENEFSAMIN